MSSLHPFVALTDRAWFDFLASVARNARLDEVNFWSPRATRPMKRMRPGEPMFFRLKRPDYAIAGYGFFASFVVLDLDEAWTMFGEKCGAPDQFRFLERIGRYRAVDLLRPGQPREPLGCTVLRDAVFWAAERWIPWGAAEGWHDNIVQGKAEGEPSRASRLMSEIEFDQRSAPEEFGDRFDFVDVDEREIVLARSLRREGQGSFRSRLLGAYEGRCAITGERTQPVLDAAHIQPYLGPRSNHVQNGLLLSKEFHALFDLGLVTVTPNYKVLVSPRLRERWRNGRRYYDFNDLRLAQVPREPGKRASPAALDWHNRRVYVP